MPEKKILAILGAGKLGVSLAQLALKAGYDVYIAGSGSPEKIRLSMDVLAPGVIATTAEDAASRAEIVILAMPLSKYQSVPKSVLADKLVIDAMNYWWEVDGNREDLRNPQTSTSEMVQSYLDASRVVKAFSHMGYHHLVDEAKPPGASARKAIAIAGDDAHDTHIASELIDDLGFEPLIIGNLSAGKRLEPGSPAFGANEERESLKKLLGLD